jgi:dTDP-4-amino-4,6-dideoxygalactose transaminase
MDGTESGVPRVRFMSASHAPRLAPASLEPAALPAAPPRIPVARAYMPQIGSVLPYLRQIDEARWYSNYGPLLLDFEARLAERFTSVTSIATLGSGTLALTIALQALGARAGGYCILPSWTFVATAHAVAQAGLQPWFLDVDPETWMLDPEATRALLKEAPGPVHAVIPVAAFGRLPDLQAWARFRAETGLPVLLDAAAAFDTLDDAPVPAMISLHATKILGVGEGGFIATRDEALATSIRKRANFGFLGDRVAREVATNAKLSEYAAALGHAGLDHWPATRMRYMLSAQRLRIALIDAPEVVFQPGWGSEWVSTTCAVSLPEGSAGHVAESLAADGVETRRWWGLGCHRAPAFAGAERTALPVTDRLAHATIGLPFALDMDDAAISRVADAVVRAVRGANLA